MIYNILGWCVDFFELDLRKALLSPYLSIVFLLFETRSFFIVQALIEFAVSPGCPRTHDHAASASGILGLQACTMPGQRFRCYVLFSASEALVKQAFKAQIMEEKISDPGHPENKQVLKQINKSKARPGMGRHV